MSSAMRIGSAARSGPVAARVPGVVDDQRHALCAGGGRVNLIGPADVQTQRDDPAVGAQRARMAGGGVHPPGSGIEEGSE